MSKIKIILLIALCLNIYIFMPFNKHGGNMISCKADVSYHWNDERLDLLITQHLQDGKGIISMSGVLYKKDKTKAYLGKTVSFSYKKNRSFYYLRSELIMDSPQMTMKFSEQKRWLPDFFIYINNPLLLKIQPYGNDAWLFFPENTPIFVCERSH